MRKTEANTVASGRARARFVIDAAAVERTARRERREKAAEQIRQALSDELLVAVDALFGARRDGPRYRHRLGQRQHGDDQGRHGHLAQGAQGKIRHRQRRQTRRQSADSLDAGDLLADDVVEQRRNQAADDHRRDHVGKFRDVAFRQETGDQRHRTDRSDIRVDLADLQPELMQDFIERHAARDGQTEETFDLAGGDEHGGPGRKADNHGMRDEVDQGSHVRQAKNELIQADQKGQR
jgi:hypothetical protein